MNDLNEMWPVCQQCPYWEVCPPPYDCTKMKMILDKKENQQSEWVFSRYNPNFSPFDCSPNRFYKCKICNYETEVPTNYCPNCGRKCFKCLELH